MASQKPAKPTKPAGGGGGSNWVDNVGAFTKSTACTNVLGVGAVAFAVTVTALAFVDMGGHAPPRVSTSVSYDSDTGKYDVDPMWRASKMHKYGPRLKTTAEDFTEVRFAATAVNPKTKPVQAFIEIEGSGKCTPIPLETVVLFANEEDPSAIVADKNANLTVPMAKSAIHVLGSANPIGSGHYDVTLAANCKGLNASRAEWYNYKLTSDAIANLSSTDYMDYSWDGTVAGKSTDKSFAYYYTAASTAMYLPITTPATTTKVAYVNKAAEMFNAPLKSDLHETIVKAAIRHRALVYLTASTYSTLWNTCDDLYQRVLLIAKENNPDVDHDVCDVRYPIKTADGVVVPTMPIFSGAATGAGITTWSKNYAMMSRMAEMIAIGNEDLGTIAGPSTDATKPGYFGPGWGGDVTEPTAADATAQGQRDDEMNEGHAIPDWGAFRKGCINSQRTRFVTTCAMVNSRGCGMGNCGLSAALALYYSNENTTDYTDLLWERDTDGTPKKVFTAKADAEAALGNVYDANGQFSVLSPSQLIKDTRDWARLRNVTVTTMAVGTLGFVLLIVCMLARLPASDELGALQIVAYTAVVVHVVVVVVLSCFAMVLMGPQFSGVLPSTSNALHESFYARTNVLVYYYTSTLVCYVLSTIFVRNMKTEVKKDGTDTQVLIVDGLYAFGYLAMLLESVMILVWANTELNRKTCVHSDHSESGLHGTVALAALGLVFVVLGCAKDAYDRYSGQPKGGTGEQSKQTNERPTFGGPLFINMCFVLGAVWTGVIMAGPGILSQDSPGCGSGFMSRDESGYDFGDIMHVLLVGTGINLLISGLMLIYAIGTASLHPTTKGQRYNPFERIASIVHDTLSTTFNVSFVRGAAVRL
jgi:hypothetical protein